MPQTVLQIAQTLRDAVRDDRQVLVTPDLQVRERGRWDFKRTDHPSVIRAVVHAATREGDDANVVHALRHIIYSPNSSSNHATRLQEDFLRAAVEVGQRRRDEAFREETDRRRGEAWFDAYNREHSVPIGNQYDPLDPNSPPPGYGAEANGYSLHDPALHGPLDDTPKEPIQELEETVVIPLDPEPEDGMNTYYEERQAELPSYDSLDTSEWRASQVPSMLEVDQAFRSKPGEMSSYAN